jgi:hypothetical protein
MSSVVVITIDRLGDGTINSPFNAGFVTDLKDMIPSRKRSWDPDDKSWWVHADYALVAIEICEMWFHDVRVKDMAAVSSGQHDPDYTTLHLLPSAPWPVVDAAYRQLARIHHPDAGGDTEGMQKINAAFDRVKSKRLDNE